MWLTLMLKSLVTIAKKIPYQIYVLVGLGICIWLYGLWQFNKGQADIQAQWDASIERGKARIEQLKAQQLTVNMIVDTQFVERTKVIKEKGEVLVKEIPVYIPVDTPDLPGGFRVLHDAAVRSTIPSAAESIGAAPVRVADATETIIGNYTTCHLIREEVEAWRQWYQEQSELWKSAECKVR